MTHPMIHPMALYLTPITKSNHHYDVLFYIYIPINVLYCSVITYARKVTIVGGIAGVNKAAEDAVIALDRSERSMVLPLPPGE